MTDTAHAVHIARLLQGFDVMDTSRLKLEVALLIIGESPTLETLCLAITMLKAPDNSISWLDRMGSALAGPVNCLYSASIKRAAPCGSEGSAIKLSAFG